MPPHACCTIANATTALTEMTRNVGRFRAARAGSVTGVDVTTTDSRTAGSITETVYKNTGLAGGPPPGDNTTCSAVLTTGSKAAQPFAVDLSASSRFAAGEELYIMVSPSGWGPLPVDVLAALEIED